MQIAILRVLCAPLLLILVLATEAPSAIITFTDAGLTNDWLEGPNWSSSQPPTTADNAMITASAQPAVVSQPGNVARYVDVRDNGVLNVTGGDLTFGWSNNRWLWIGFQTPGRVVQSAGTVRGTGQSTDLIIDEFGTYEMSGGLLDISDDLSLLFGSEMVLSGAPTITIGDDLLVPQNESSAMFITLTGSQEPQFLIGDDLNLRGSLDIVIDSVQWAGGSTIDLFNVGNQMRGQINSVTLDGVLLDPADYPFSGGTVTIAVNEPATATLALLFLPLLLIRTPRRARAR